MTGQNPNVSNPIGFQFRWQPNLKSAFDATMTIPLNMGKSIAPGANLCFSFARSASLEVLSDDHTLATEIAQDGDFYCITFLEGVPKSSTVQVRFFGDGAPLRKWSDAPAGVFWDIAEEGLTDVPPADNRCLGDLENLQFVSVDTGILESTIEAPGALVPAPVDQQNPSDSSGLWSIPNSIGYRSNHPVSFWFAELISQDFHPDNDGPDLDIQVSEGMATDAYELRVAPEGVVLKGGPEGLQLGLVTLAQKVWQCSEGVLKPTQISDQPAHHYRGFMLDVVRHFFPVATIKKLLDSAAWLKLNHFHWHLTDDDGWRVASQAYPQLNKIALRGPGRPLPPQMGSGSKAYGGIYSPEDIKEVVAYAQARGITVVPEMDIPGHARALIRALPEIVEAGDQSQYESVQFHRQNVLSVAEPKVLTVLTTLLDEWLELFPGRLIHLGSDEVPEGAWTGSPAAKTLMEQLGLPSVEALHGWFLRQLQDHLAAKGRQCGGWEEVRTGQSVELDQGVTTDAWVYSWQGEQAGQDAAEAGHPVVLCPAQTCYLDLAYSDHEADPGYYWAGTLDLQKVYSYQPRAHSKVMGLQACLWTELVASEQRLSFMLLPRLLAFAEVAWGTANLEAFDDFKGRAAHWQSFWKALGWNGVRPESHW